LNPGLASENSTKFNNYYVKVERYKSLKAAMIQQSGGAKSMKLFELATDDPVAYRARGNIRAPIMARQVYW